MGTSASVVEGVRVVADCGNANIMRVIAGPVHADVVRVMAAIVQPDAGAAAARANSALPTNAGSTPAATAAT